MNESGFEIDDPVLRTVNSPMMVTSKRRLHAMSSGMNRHLASINCCGDSRVKVIDPSGELTCDSRMTVVTGVAPATVVDPIPASINRPNAMGTR